MSITAFASGTQAASIGVEHFLASPNVVGKFRLLVDLNAMTATDVVELRAYKMVLTGGTQRVVWRETYSGAQDPDALIAMPEREVWNELTDANAVRFSLIQTIGTGRSFPWVVLKDDPVTALLDLAAGVETGWTVRQALRIILAVCAGKLNGAATTTINIRDMADSKNRIQATVDASGNRSVVTRDAT